jgi:Tol biopolymer transport system component
MEDEPSGQSPFLVIELDESVWISEDAPQIVLSERENWADWNKMWTWSGDGKYVVYTIIGLVDGEVEQTLYYSPTDKNEPVILSNGRMTDSLGALSLSPNGDYLAFEGICPDGTLCQIVMQMTTEDIVWTSQMVDPPNLFFGGYIYWSPDSRFFARNGDQGIMIIDIITQEVVLQFDYVANAIAWLED